MGTVFCIICEGGSEECREVVSYEYGFRLPSKAKTPLSATYRPELDISKPLAPDGTNWYQSALGVGRVDVDTHTTGITINLWNIREQVVNNLNEYKIAFIGHIK